jgi:hypothetical protein
MSFLRKIFAKNKDMDYVSDVEKFMHQFDQKHPQQSLSQQKEIKKFKRIFYLRDHVVQAAQNKIWEGF